MELTEFRSLRVDFRATNATNCAVVVMHPFRHVTGHVKDTVLIGLKRRYRRSGEVAVIIIKHHFTEVGPDRNVRKVSGIFGWRKLLAPRVFQNISTAIGPSNPCPLCLGWQPITGRVRVETNHFFPLSPVEKRQTFLLAQPVAV